MVLLVSYSARLLIALTLISSSLATQLLVPQLLLPRGALTAVAGGAARVWLPPARVVRAPSQQTGPVLQISKSEDLDPVTPGATLRYTIVYSNAGDASASNVVITETYPSNTTYFFALPSPTTGNNVWSIGNLAPGATGVITAVVTVANQLPVGTVLTNTVRIHGSSLPLVSFTETTQVNSAPDLSITKSDSEDPVRPGDSLIYTIQYKNDGDAPVTGIRITETYPSQVTFESANPPPDAGNNVWLPSTLGGLGQSRLIYVTVRVKSPLSDGAALANQVVLDTNETAPLVANQGTTVQAPVIALTKSASPNPPLANNVLTYTLRYTNSGSTYASGVVVTDAVPLNATYLACAPVACSHNGGIVTWEVGQVPAHSSHSLTLAVNVANNLNNGTLLTNTARIAAVENISAFARITNTVSSAPEISLSKSDGVSQTAADDDLTYVLSYANTGAAPARNVVITDRIPANVVFEACTPACTALGGGVYSFTLDTLDAAKTGNVTLEVEVDSPLPLGLRAITNTARILTTTGGDNPSNNFAVDVDTITTVPQLAIRAAFDSIPPYPTKLITYTLRYTNTAAMSTTGVVISVTQSPFATYVPSGWTFAGGNIYTRAIGSLAAGASGSAPYVMRLPSPYLSGTESFVNNFLIHDDGPTGLPVATAVTTATLGVPDLLIENVSLSPGAVVAGELFTATVIIRNEGAGRACNPKVAGCGGFGLDVFIAPDAPPATDAYSSHWDTYAGVGSLAPGVAATVKIKNLKFNVGDEFMLYFKADNWDCVTGDPCLPSNSPFGLVPESDEYNNVYAVVVPDRSNIRVYLPVVLKRSP
ncbi:MAG TPA: DUF11 domain-containing protein [Anaerolineae bacterium]|nr:DUF11 domain-containing protein [Anaerolineae bacterium]